jgi:hypothetical protein
MVPFTGSSSMESSLSSDTLEISSSSEELSSIGRRRLFDMIDNIILNEIIA